MFATLCTVPSTSNKHSALFFDNLKCEGDLIRLRQFPQIIPWLIEILEPVHRLEFAGHASRLYVLMQAIVGSYKLKQPAKVATVVSVSRAGGLEVHTIVVNMCIGRLNRNSK